jgi:[NiFe] hydrogenase diaphorase moiety large subunit
MGFIVSELSVNAFTRRTLQHWQQSPGNLLQVLLDIQHAFNHIPEQARTLIADQLQINPAQIQRNTDFYSFLHQHPRGTYDVLFSDNIVEQLKGSRALCDQLASQLGMQVSTTRADGRLSLDYTSCTGMSDQGPAALINGHAMPGLNPEQIRQMAQLIETSTPLDQWPQDWFQVQTGIQRKDLLLDNAPSPGAAIKKLLEAGPDFALQELQKSTLRGRGGAGFSTASKWSMCRTAESPDKVVVCNADEGEPGTFKDRLLLQEYADGVIEGMTLCAAIIGASQGFIYLRGEYRYLKPKLEQVLQSRRDGGLLGEGILNQDGFNFDIDIHLGAGAYICGEESALIESLEGKPGIPRLRPPFPVTNGYRGLPTVVDNAETLLAVAVIINQGADKFLALGTPESAGTKLLSISGDCARPGIYEYPFGITLEQILLDCGAGDTQMLQVSGAAGHCLHPDEFERQIAFEDLATSGSFMIFDRSRDVLEIVQNFTHFFRHEGCGFCTPCRIGTRLLQKHLDTIVLGHGSQADLDMIKPIGELMRNTSHCGLGHTAPNALLESMDKFSAVYQDRLKSTGRDPGFDLQSALEPEEADEQAAVH